MNLGKREFLQVLTAAGITYDRQKNRLDTATRFATHMDYRVSKAD